METERREITVGDLTFDVRVGGPDRGPWVLLLHGFPVNSSCYDDVADRLHESGLRTIQVDQRGYSPGARPEGVEAYRLEALVDDDFSLVALKQAASRGRLEAIIGSDGRYRSSKSALEEYKASKYSRGEKKQ